MPPSEYDPGSTLAAQCRRLVGWARDDALPLWLERGVHDSGGFVEALDFDGRPVSSTVSRVRVQARQVFSFCVGRDLGLLDAAADPVIVDGAEFLRHCCRRSDGLYGSTVDLGRGELVDETPDLYDTAFVLLALTRALARFDSAALRRGVHDVLDGLDTHFARARGDGYCERLPAPRLRLQNPHMHLFESMLSLAAIDDDGRKRARRLFDFIESRFIDSDLGVVWERIDADGESPDRTFEPGHSFEWIWLLAERERVLSDDSPELMQTLYRRVCDAVGDARAIALESTLERMSADTGARLWSQTEAFRAHLEMSRHLRGAAGPAAADAAARTLTHLFDDWLQPAVAGGWHDHFDGSGRLVSGHMPASSLYHLMTAVEAAAEQLQRNGA